MVGFTAPSEPKIRRGSWPPQSRQQHHGLLNCVHRVPLRCNGWLLLLLVFVLVFWEFFDDLATLAAAVPVLGFQLIAPYWIPPTAPDAPWPVVVPGLLAAPWAGTFKPPTLLVPRYPYSADPTEAPPSLSTSPLDVPTPAFLMLHIFSMPTLKSQARRQLIRKYSPLRAVPRGFRHLVEVKFILGPTREQDGWMTEEQLYSEMDQHEDIIVLDFPNGENMDQGKSIDWLQWVGRRERQAHWCWKCDDDTVLLMPNLLAELTQLDASTPTYIGTSLDRSPRHNLHFLGLAYGISWPVVQAVGEADISRHIIEVNTPEDTRMGSLMFSLPSKPDQPDLLSKYPCLATTPPNCTDTERETVIAPDIYAWTRTATAARDYPRAPDPRTGLHYVNLLNKLVQFKHMFNALRLGTRTVVGWHGLKKDEDLVASEIEAEQGFTGRGRAYEWVVPDELQYLYDASE